MPEIGKILQCKQERSNLEDLNAVSIVKGDTIVGHVPCEKSKCGMVFIEHDGVVTCQVINQQKHGESLEVPCVCIISLYALNSKCL